MNGQKTQIDNIRSALFDGRFADASKIVEDMRQQDPQLNDLGESLINNPFGLFSFSSFSTDCAYVSEQLLIRRKLVLSWLCLPQQLNLFGLAIEPENVCVDLLRSLKFNELTSKSRNDLVHVVGFLLSHQKIQEAKYVMEQIDISLHDKVNNILLVYKNKNTRGALGLNIDNMPLYTAVAFNYTNDLLEFIRSQGVTLEQISSTFATVDESKSSNSDVLQRYKDTQFVALKSYVEHCVITQSLDGLKGNSPTVARKKI